MSKEAWEAAKAELKAIERVRDAVMKAAVEPIREFWEAAQAKLDDIEDASPDHIGVCEGCLEHIWKGERYGYDSNNSLYFCERCSPSYQDMLANPTSFCGEDGEYLTPAQAKEIVDAHLATGGALTDKMVSA